MAEELVALVQVHTMHPIVQKLDFKQAREAWELLATRSKRDKIAMNVSFLGLYFVMGTSNSHVRDAFEIAKNEFMTSQKDGSLFDHVSNVTNVHDIYEFVMQFQSQQSNTTGMRCLRRINGFLDGLRQYSQVIEQFVQVKPDVLALIWGPIKLLLQMANVTLQSFNAIVNAMVSIGNCLPMFETFGTLFKQNDRVKDALVLFYKDILDFFDIALNFLNLKHWKLVFESVWPKHSSKIDVVVSNMKRHSLLLRDEVDIEHISEAYRARELDFDRWARTFEFQARQDFNELQNFISPKLYDDDQDRFQSNLCERTGSWIQRHKIMSKWFNPDDTSTRLVWLQGIPGAEDMRTKLYETYRSSQRDLKSNTKFARETLCSFLHCMGPVHVVIDGLDELPESQRATTLREILNVLQDAPQTKILISSRMEDDISRIMRKTSHKALRVDDNNRGCIQSFVSITSQKWLDDSDFDENNRAEIMQLLTLLAAKAKGL
ncbi:NACHT nucleoside triphosphatase [Penicillium chermesinum]|nr:NACHT nucleoside triphosphatase [Penicillium chermesinum]